MADEPSHGTSKVTSALVAGAARIASFPSLSPLAELQPQPSYRISRIAWLSGARAFVAGFPCGGPYGPGSPVLLFQQRRPNAAYGLLWLPQCWLTIIGVLICIYLIGRDLRRWRSAPRLASVIVLTMVALHAPVASAQQTRPTDSDWPGFLGPARNAVTEGTPLADQWPADGPPRVWRIPCDVGHSGPMIKDGILVLMDRKPKPKIKGPAATAPTTLPDEVVHGIDAATGRELWHADFPCSWKGDEYFWGPSATPAAAGDGTFVCMGASGVLRCMDLRTGKLRWEKDLPKEYGNARPDTQSRYDVCSSPLIVNGLVLLEVCSASAGVVAWRIADGAEAWRTGGFSNYGSSLGFLRWHDIPAALFITRGQSPSDFPGRKRDVFALDAATGKLLWYAYAEKSYYNTPVAISDGDLVVVEGGGGDGPTFAFHPPPLPGQPAPLAWKDPDHIVRFSNYLIFRGMVFGQGFKAHGGPHLLWCATASDGKLLWQHEVKETHQWMLASDGKVFQLHEDGQLSMFQATPRDSYMELGRAKVTGHTWSAPALVRGKLYVRSDTELLCLDLGDARIQQ